MLLLGVPLVRKKHVYQVLTSLWHGLYFSNWLLKRFYYETKYYKEDEEFLKAFEYITE